MLCWLVALVVRTKTKLRKTEARHYSLRGYVETHDTTCTRCTLNVVRFQCSHKRDNPSAELCYALVLSFYSGALLTLSLAILLHVWCRCTVPSASIESSYLELLTFVLHVTYYVYCMYVVCPQTADIRGARAPEN